MVRLLANDEMIESWWQFNASDIDSTTYNRYATNPSYHGSDTRYRVGEPVSCTRNADLFLNAATATPPGSELSSGAIIGLVVGLVGGTEWIGNYEKLVLKNIEFLSRMNLTRLII